MEPFLVAKELATHPIPMPFTMAKNISTGSPMSGIGLNGRVSSYANLPEYNGPGDVLGCGLLIDPDNELAIFFTLNGSLMGQFQTDWAWAPSFMT
jgi:hypothetical protein